MAYELGCDLESSAPESARDAYRRLSERSPVKRWLVRLYTHRLRLHERCGEFFRLLDELKETPPTAEELERVRAQVIAGLVYERDSIAQQATTIGQLETVGLSWHLIDEELAALEAVTPADIQAAARRYFTRSRLTVAHLLPEGASHD